MLCIPENKEEIIHHVHVSLLSKTALSFYEISIEIIIIPYLIIKSRMKTNLRAI